MLPNFDASTSYCSCIGFFFFGAPRFLWFLAGIPPFHSCCALRLRLLVLVLWPPVFFPFFFNVSWSFSSQGKTPPVPNPFSPSSSPCRSGRQTSRGFGPGTHSTCQVLRPALLVFFFHVAPFPSSLACVDFPPHMGSARPRWGFPLGSALVKPPSCTLSGDV